MSISKLPREVYHNNRKTNKKFYVGKVIKEVGLEHSSKQQKGDYYKLIQLIEDDKGKKHVRFAYYIKDKGKPRTAYQWGSQTTFQMSRPLFRKLLERAKNKGII